MTPSLPAEIQGLASQWVSQARTLRRLTGGKINENWVVDTSEGQLVIRIYPPGRRKKQIEFEMAVMKHLWGRGLAVPALREANSAPLIAEHQDRYAVCLELLPAEPLSSAEALAVSPEELGAFLRPIREALETFSPPFRPARETRVFARSLPSLLSQLSANEQARITHLFDGLRAWEESIDLPSTTIHADIHPGNVLRSVTGQLHLIDFDDAHVAPRAIDWVLPALQFSGLTQGKVAEERYEELLNTISGGRATPAEERAFSTLRTLLTLKCAVFAAACDVPIGDNTYLAELNRRPPLEA